MKTFPLAHSLDHLLGTQCPSGAFPSMVLQNHHQYADENGFITALVLHHLRLLPQDHRIRHMITKGIEFLKTCANPHQPHFFHFYPPGQEPAWMGTTLPPDTDDTVLYTTLLLTHGAISTTHAQQTITQLESYRLLYRPEFTLPWIMRGAYKTWLSQETRANPIDCCVNANAATLLASLNQFHHPAYEATTQSVIRAIHWVTHSPQLLPFLCPFYPNPGELYLAMTRAIQAGVTEFSQPLLQLAPLLPKETNLPICSSPDHLTRWFSPALIYVRKMALKRASGGQNPFYKKGSGLPKTLDRGNELKRVL